MRLYSRELSVFGSVVVGGLCLRRRPLPLFFRFGKRSFLRALAGRTVVLLALALAKLRKKNEKVKWLVLVYTIVLQVVI
jgi:hypothetical protein